MIEVGSNKTVERWMDERTSVVFRKELPALAHLTISNREVADLQLLACGAFSPLKGFLSQDDYHSVLEDCRLASGALWPLPIVLGVEEEKVKKLPEAGPVALWDRNGRLLGCIFLKKIFRRDLRKEAHAIYGAEDTRHPGVARLLTESEYLVGGRVQVLRTGANPWFLPWEPEETKKLITKKGWKTVAGFQTRNPIHRAHEYLHKVTLELVDGLLIHPLVGETKADDLPAIVRLECYRVLLKNYYPEDRVLLGVFPGNMRYAGPREALFHALVRKNYGCSHMIIGRDHAGVGGYYQPYEAQEFCERFISELGIILLSFEDSFYCQRCGQMATDRTCPHPGETRLRLSGTQVRQTLEKGGELPAELSRPEVVSVLKEFYKRQKSVILG